MCRTRVGKEKTMNRQEAKQILPIIRAFADGKTIEFKNTFGDWINCGEIMFNWPPKDYRIKPEPKYRPFKDTEECWQEMQKHQPFGWIKNNCEYKNISSIRTGKALRPILINIEICGEPYENSFNMAKMLEYYTFVDGAPFGIKEE